MTPGGFAAAASSCAVRIRGRMGPGQTVFTSDPGQCFSLKFVFEGFKINSKHVFGQSTSFLIVVLMVSAVALASIDVRQRRSRFPYVIAYAIEIRLQAFKTDQIVANQLAREITKDRDLGTCQMSVISTLDRRKAKHIDQRPVPGTEQILP
jgi:hypothetical protein